MSDWFIKHAAGQNWRISVHAADFDLAVASARRLGLEVEVLEEGLRARIGIAGQDTAMTLHRSSQTHGLYAQNLLADRRPVRLAEK